jgi:hypothetical protein
MLNTSQYQISQRQRLSELRIKLLHLHKLLLETERLTYEQVRGHVSAGELLQLVINHEQRRRNDLCASLIHANISDFI